MKRIALAMALALAAFAASASAQRLAVGIAPAFDAGGDDFGPAVVEHLTLFLYQDLLTSKQFAPTLLNPGGVYTPLDTSWLSDYVQDRPDLDLLLVSTLKPVDSIAKGSSTITIEISLLDARTGDTKSTWSVSETMKSTNAWLQKGEAMVTSTVNDRVGQYGLDMMSSEDFEKQPMGKTTAHLADSIRDTLPAHLGGFVRTAAAQPSATPAPSAAPCPMHTRITYKYKHSASHSYTLLANGLDQTTTIQDGLSTFNAPEGPLLLQFTIQDTPYKLARQPIYQLSTTHSCKADTLVMDVGQGGDVHEHWE